AQPGPGHGVLPACRPAHPQPPPEPGMAASPAHHRFPDQDRPRLRLPRRLRGERTDPGHQDARPQRGRQDGQASHPLRTFPRIKPPPRPPQAIRLPRHRPLPEQDRPHGRTCRDLARFRRLGGRSRARANRTHHPTDSRQAHPRPKQRALGWVRSTGLPEPGPAWIVVNRWAVPAVNGWVNARRPERTGPDTAEAGAPVLAYLLGMPRKRPTPEDTVAARRMLLDGLTRDADIFELADELAPLHPRNNTFPGEVFLHLAADALDWCGASRTGPLSLEQIRDRFLPECTFRGRQTRSSSTPCWPRQPFMAGPNPTCSMRLS